MHIVNVRNIVKNYSYHKTISVIRLNSNIFVFLFAKVFTIIHFYNASQYFGQVFLKKKESFKNISIYLKKYTHYNNDDLAPDPKRFWSYVNSKKKISGFP